MDAASLLNASIMTGASSVKGISPGRISAFCLIGETYKDATLHEVLNSKGYKIFTSETGEEFIEQIDVAYVVDEFEGPVFHYLLEAKKTIYGPTVIKEIATMKMDLPRMKRPLYCRSMDQLVACFSGFKQSSVLEEMVKLVHYMGGSVRKEYTTKVTHVVASSTQGAKYRLAIGAGIPVMSEEWIRKAWEKRRRPQSYAFSDEMKIYKLPALYQLKLAFYGFSLDEKMTMTAQAQELGASVTEPIACTHFVINTETEEKSIPHKPNDSCILVSSEWFWTSAHLHVCANEKEYAVSVDKPQNGIGSPSTSDLLKASGILITRARTATNKRRSMDPFNTTGCVEDGNDMSCALADHMFSVDDLDALMKSPAKSGDSKRRHICLEMLQTETNYVQVLRTITTVFKEPLERPDAFGERILNTTDIKMIFGNISDILAVHENICSKLGNLVTNWDEKNCIGRVWVEHKDDLMKNYPPFVNFFETAKEALSDCLQKHARFQAYLKVCQSKPECGRQSLQELLIRPVQRLPSVDLLLNDLLKHTDKAHEDHKWLIDAISDLRRVLTFLNENKRKTEGQMELFEILNEIEDCPVHLLSAQRQLIAQVDVTDLSGRFSKKKNAILTFYLFNDCIEVAKKKDKKTSVSNLGKKGMKTRKHKDHIRFSQVRRVVNVFGSSPEEAANHIFCLTMRDTMSESSHSFGFLGFARRRDSISNNVNLAENKREFLHSLCNHITLDTGRCGFCCEDYDAEATPIDDFGAAISKAVTRVKGEQSLKRSYSTLRGARQSSGTLRRSISQAMTNFRGTLGRVSRSNLRLPLHEIMEEAANLSKAAIKNDSASNFLD